MQQWLHLMKYLSHALLHLFHDLIKITFAEFLPYFFLKKLSNYMLVANSETQKYFPSIFGISYL